MTRETRSGIVPPAEAATLSGRELLQGMIDGRFPAPPITQTLTFWLTEAGEGSAVFEGEPDPRRHGPGPVFVLADPARG